MSLIEIYIRQMIPYSIFGMVIYIIVRLIRIKGREKEIVWKREITFCLFVGYTMGVLSQTILPYYDMGIDSLTGSFFFNLNRTNDRASLNLIPFHTLYEYLYTTNETVDSWNQVISLNLAANVFLFMPFGFFLPTLWEKFQSWKNILIFGVSFSFGVEFIQYFIGRSSDIDDLILNTIGISFGFLLFRFLYKNHIK